MTLKVSEQFSQYPGGRDRISGAHSAEEFYEKHLLPAMNKAIVDGKELIVNLDGTAGFAGSFLDEAFGRLTLNFNDVQLKLTLVIVSTEEPELIEAAWASIKEWREMGAHDNSSLVKNSN